MLNFRKTGMFQPNQWNRFHNAVNLNRNSKPEEHPVEQRSQPVMYSHPDVGKPVKETCQMMQPAAQNNKPQSQARQ